MARLRSARDADWAALAALQKSGARVSASAVDLSDNSVIQQINSGRAADARVADETHGRCNGAQRVARGQDVQNAAATLRVRSNNGQLDGDLYLVGAGDPSLTGDSLLGLAGQIKSAGFKSVSGKLWSYPRRSTSVECETKDRCDAFGSQRHRLRCAARIHRHRLRYVVC